MTKYRVSELAHLCGVGPRTVDFYTNLGLLEPLERSGGGHRFYGADAPERVRTIKALQAGGFSLQEIRARLRAANPADALLAQAERLRQELNRIESEVATLSEEIASLPERCDEGRGAKLAIQASMLCALGVAQKVALLLSDIEFPLG